MLSEKTIKLCINKLDQEYQVLLKRTSNNEILNIMMGKDLYVYEHALYELKNELEIIQEENLNE
jgi:hypothetical protein